MSIKNQNASNLTIYDTNCKQTITSPNIISIIAWKAHSTPNPRHMRQFILHLIPPIIRVQQFFVLLVLAIQFQIWTISAGHPEECSLYLVEGAHSRQGVYTTKSIPGGEYVSQADISVALTDSEWIEDGRYERYFWDVQDLSETYFGRSTAIQSFPLGSLTNPSSSQYNIEMGSVRYDPGLAGHNSPGSGAFSYFTSRTYKSSRPIQAGEELLMDYPSASAASQTDEDQSTNQDIEKIKLIAEELISLEDKQNINQIDEIIKSVKNVISLFDDRISQLVPDNYEDLKIFSASSEIAPDSVFSDQIVNWIKNNGQCLDNIKPGKSSIPQAGQGAFTTRFIDEGEVIVPIPLLHFTDHAVLDIDETDRNDKQLLTNYCFTHEESTVLLCPLSHGALINHGGEGGVDVMDGPNAEIRWSQWDSTTMDTLNLSWEELKKKDGKGLAFEVVATRDLMPGEEVLIDYGASWEKAWEEHRRHYISQSSAVYIPPKEMNENKELKTVYELAKHPLPNNIMTVCKYWEETEKDIIESDDPQPDTNSSKVHSFDAHGNFPREKLNDMLDSYAYYGADFVPTESNGDYWPCEVYERYDDQDTYTVRILQAPSEPQTSWDALDIPLFLTDYPRNSIVFIDKPYSSDQFLSNAFRHTIGISDAIFPDQWKNKTPKENHHFPGFFSGDTDGLLRKDRDR